TILIIAAVLLACAPVVGGIAAVAVIGPGKTLLWAYRQVMLLNVRGGPEIVFEVDADAVRRKSYELLRRSVIYQLRTAKVTFNTHLTDAGVEVSVQEADRETAMNVLRSKLAADVETRLADDGLIHIGLTNARLVEWAVEESEHAQALLSARF